MPEDPASVVVILALKLIGIDFGLVSLCCIGVASWAIKELSETFASPFTSRARFRAPLVA